MGLSAFRNGNVLGLAFYFDDGLLEKSRPLAVAVNLNPFGWIRTVLRTVFSAVERPRLLHHQPLYHDTDGVIDRHLAVQKSVRKGLQFLDFPHSAFGVSHP